MKIVLLYTIDQNPIKPLRRLFCWKTNLDEVSRAVDVPYWYVKAFLGVLISQFNKYSNQNGGGQIIVRRMDDGRKNF